MLERHNGRLDKARVIIGAAPGASRRDGHVRFNKKPLSLLLLRRVNRMDNRTCLSLLNAKLIFVYLNISQDKAWNKYV